MEGMATHDLSQWQHTHAFDPGNRSAERRTWIVVAITAATMVAEIIGGWVTGSMALLADGWHMATHVVALSIAGIAYLLARRWARDERFAFGTWKIEVLGAFSSALILGMVALAMVWESIHRLLHPEQIRFVPALVVAAVGLAVNIVSAFVLEGGHDHHGHDHHGHDHDDHHHHDEHEHHDHEHHDYPHAHDHKDLNLQSAYVHVITDALTSVLAIVALGAGLWLGWTWLDPVMGIVGAAVIAWWARGLVRDSSRVLLDREMDSPIVGEIRRAVESDGDSQLADLHVWRVGRASYAAVMTIVAEAPLTPDAYRERVSGIGKLAHVSVEVNRCPHHACG